MAWVGAPTHLGRPAGRQRTDKPCRQPAGRFLLTRRYARCVGLDILTPKGQQTVADLERAVSLWEFHNPGYRYCRTPEDSPCPVDGLVIDRAGLLKGVVETKCRYDMDERKFEEEYRSEWLVTMEKLVKGSRVAAQLCVPYYGFLFLVKDGVLMTRKIADSQGQFCVPFRCDNTTTQRTVNGGEAVRANAYIDMRASRVFRA